MKKFIIILLVVLVGLAIFLALKTKKMGSDNIINPEDTGGASGQFMKLGENAIVVLEQRLTDSVEVNAINLEKSGFVIIHRDAGGKPGAVIGVSKWFGAGQYANEDIGLTESLQEGMDYYAMLHNDDGNGIFDPKNDMPVESSGEPMYGIFQASKNAPDPKGVQIYY